LSPIVRVTRYGIAGALPIGKADLLAVPSISYRDAVAAPFIEGGYRISPSDKGRYQQRSLHLARGLRFLASCFTQKESSQLLDIFFEHHLGKSPPDLYRRAVTYEDLRERLFGILRGRRKRLSTNLVENAESWLLRWTDALLERGLLLGGYVLTCSHCANRTWYRLDDIKQEHDCERCAGSTHIPANAIRSFRLNEAFYQLRLNNGEVVTLLLAVLRRDARHSLLYLPEVALAHDEAKDGEADVAALVDGELVLGEAKSNDQIANKEMKWYQYVARRTRAKGLVFATTARSQSLCKGLECGKCAEEHGAYHRDYAWKEATRERIEKLREQSAAESGPAIESHCFQSLIAGEEAWRTELADVG
jgi:hypothetical protein